MILSGKGGEQNVTPYEAQINGRDFCSNLSESTGGRSYRRIKPHCQSGKMVLGDEDKLTERIVLSGQNRNVTKSSSESVM